MSGKLILPLKKRGDPFPKLDEALAMCAIDAVADVVLAYRPKPKTTPARKRQKARRKRDAKTARD